VGARAAIDGVCDAPTRYREVVLTVSKPDVPPKKAVPSDSLSGGDANTPAN